MGLWTVFVLPMEVLTGLLSGYPCGICYVGG